MSILHNRYKIDTPIYIYIVCLFRTLTRHKLTSMMLGMPKREVPLQPPECLSNAYGCIDIGPLKGHDSHHREKPNSKNLDSMIKQPSLTLPLMQPHKREWHDQETCFHWHSRAVQEQAKESKNRELQIKLHSKRSDLADGVPASLHSRQSPKVARIR